MQSGGNNVVNNNLYLGYGSGSGTYNLGGTGQALLWAQNEYVGGNLGSGTFIQSAGTNNIASNYGTSLYLGYGAGSSGSYSLGNGQLLAFFEYVGYSGTATFTQSGGTNLLGYDGYLDIDLFLGYNAGSKGTYNLSNSGRLSAFGEYVGSSGTGAFTQTGGSNGIGGSLVLGYGTAGSGSYSLANGTLSSSSEYVGYSGTGTFTQWAGSNSAGTALPRRKPRQHGRLHAVGPANTASMLSIGAGSNYLLAGGTLQVNGSLLNQGPSPATALRPCSMPPTSSTCPAGPGRTWDRSR